jgi:ubiquinone/menaquinone biosynthesis C-methylase UbiE
MENSEDIIQFYNEFAEKYDATVLRDRDYTAYERIPAWLLEALPSPKVKYHILDLGCGTGLGSLKFFQAGHDVAGIDISPKMIECAQKLPFIQLICQSLESPLPFPENEFDAAIMLGVMEFIKKPQTLFHEIARILKSKSLFGLTVPKKLPEDLEAELGIRTYDPYVLEKQIAKEGFEIIRKEDFQGFIYKSRTISYRGYLFQIV